MRTMRYVALWVAGAGLASVLACSERGRPYLERRAGFTTRLVNPGPALSPSTDSDEQRPWQLFPGDWTIPPERISEVRYNSGELSLRAWMYVPSPAQHEPLPALVYLHPDVVGASASWLRDAKPFIDAGFVILLPDFRGENGNPGHHEFAFGEVDDAAAAIRWLAGKPFVDVAHIYAFGWSYGGFISALLSLWDDLPLRHTASSGGLITPARLKENAEMGYPLPFDLTDPTELELRALLGNVRWMKRRHFAYVGSADTPFVSAVVAARKETKGGRSLLEIEIVPGEHFAAGTPAMLRYLNLVNGERATE